jgi:flavin-dependent dehydrogenase
MLVGDAAGYVDALTGEGLSIGFQSAVAAVDAAIARDVASYPTEWRKLTRRSRLSTDLLLRGTRLRPLRKSLLPVSEAASGAFGSIVRWVA